MAQVKRRIAAAQKLAATNDRNFRTFLVVAQLEGKAIGARIAQARLEAGMTQDEVADVASFSKRSLQDYEAGNTIPYKHMREIAGLLNVEVHWLLHGGERVEPPALADLQEELAGVRGEIAALRREIRGEIEADQGQPEAPRREGSG